jgi:predicted 2-oxoglutarate/Fe(II)-dependent dioxygenase YbiX
MEAVHSELMAQFHKSVYDNDLEVLLVPGFVTFRSLNPSTSVEMQSFSQKLIRWTSSGLSNLVTVLVPLFIAYASARLFMKFHIDDSIVWISVAISSILIAVTVALFLTGPKDFK